jgi:hypothetical protein
LKNWAPAELVENIAIRAKRIASQFAAGRSHRSEADREQSWYLQVSECTSIPAPFHAPGWSRCPRILEQ